MIGLIGPSHQEYIIKHNRWDIFPKNEWDVRGIGGGPCHNKWYLNNIKRMNDVCEKIYWWVPLWRFANGDHTKLKVAEQNENIEDRLFIDNATRDIQMNLIYNEEVDTYMNNHCLKCINYIVNNYNNVRLIFWCLFGLEHRTKKNTRVCKYIDMFNRYRKHIVDIRCYYDIMDKMYYDKGIHPTDFGYFKLRKIMLEDLEK